MNDYSIQIKYGLPGYDGKIVKVVDEEYNIYSHIGVAEALRSALRKSGIRGRYVLELKITQMAWEELDEI